MAKKKIKAPARPTSDSALAREKLPARALKTISLESVQKIGNPMLPTLAADSTEIMLRGGTDGVSSNAIVRFYSVMPDAAIELSRVQLSVDHIRAIVDLFAKSIDYYPTRPREDRVAETR